MFGSRKRYDPERARRDLRRRREERRAAEKELDQERALIRSSSKELSSRERVEKAVAIARGGSRSLHAHRAALDPRTLRAVARRGYVRVVSAPPPRPPGETLLEELSREAQRLRWPARAGRAYDFKRLMRDRDRLDALEQLGGYVRECETRGPRAHRVFLDALRIGDTWVLPTRKALEEGRAAEARAGVSRPEVRVGMRIPAYEPERRAPAANDRLAPPDPTPTTPQRSLRPCLYCSATGKTHEGSNCPNCGGLGGVYE